MTSQSVWANFRARDTTVRQPVRPLDSQSDGSLFGLSPSTLRQGLKPVHIGPVQALESNQRLSVTRQWLPRQEQWSACQSGCPSARSVAPTSLWRWTKPSRTSCSTTWVLVTCTWLSMFVVQYFEYVLSVSSWCFHTDHKHTHFFPFMFKGLFWVFVFHVLVY